MRRSAMEMLADLTEATREAVLSRWRRDDEKRKQEIQRFLANNAAGAVVFVPNPDNVHLGSVRIMEGGLVVFNSVAALFLKSQQIRSLSVVINELVEVDRETVVDISFFPRAPISGDPVIRYDQDVAMVTFPSLVGLAGSFDVSWDADFGCLSGGF